VYPAVTKVIPHEDFTLTVRFDDGKERILDMKPFLGAGIFKRIAEYSQFKTVHVVFDTVVWDCGVDLDPEFVYAECKTKARA
jgi:hypothetical protein